MAETIEKKYLDQAGLTHYDEKIKKVVSDGDAATLAAAKKYVDDTEQFDKAGTAATKVKELADGAVKDNTDAIAKLNSGADVEGSVAKTVADAKKELEGKITESQYDDTALTARVSANEGAIEVLNGTGVGSVDKKVADAVASIVAEAPEAYDTLKEISDWISSHESDASAMNSAIQTNKADIANLTKLVGTLPEGDASKTIVEYINSKVGAVDFSEAIATAKQEAIDAAKADATTKAGTAEQNAKDYADGLASNYATAAQGAKADTALQEADVASLRTDVGNNKTAISGIDTRVSALESVSIESITNEEIDALFAEKAE